MTLIRRVSKPVWLLAIIVILASILRLSNLEYSPAGALIDEASYGYIGYSLLHTGRDEHGVVWPMHFMAFGDQKLPAYAYILIPTIKVFGLNNFATRLPSALAGIMLVPIIYLVSRRIGMSSGQGIIASLIVAVSPWTIILSRFGYESNIALILLAMGIYTMLRTLQSKRLIWTILTAVILGLCWYTYIPYRLITLLCSVVFVTFLLKSRSSWKVCVLYTVIFTLLIAPVLPHTFSTFGSSRLNQARYVQSEGTRFAVEDRRAYCQRALPGPICKLFVNKYTASLGQTVTHYILTFVPEYLFVRGEGGMLYLSVAGYGVLFFPLILLYIAGVYSVPQLLAGKTYRHAVLLVLVVTAIAAIPSAIVGEPQRIRLSGVVPGIVLILASGYGLVEQHLRTRFSRAILMMGVSGVLLYCTASYSIDLFTVHTPKYLIEYSSHLRQASTYISKNLGEETVYYEGIGENYPLYYAYYNAVDPADYQQHAVYTPLDVIGFTHPIDYRNIQMKKLTTDELICKYRVSNKIFYLMTPEDLLAKKALIYPPVFRVASGDGNSSLLNIYRIDPRTYPSDCSTNRMQPISL